MAGVAPSDGVVLTVLAGVMLLNAMGYVALTQMLYTLILGGGMGYRTPPVPRKIARLLGYPQAS